MKVLWLCNIPLPQIAIDLGIPEYLGGGWLEGLSKAIVLNKNIELHYAFFAGGAKSFQRSIIKDSIHFHALPSSRNSNQMQHTLNGLVNSIQPDIVHVFGSEYGSSNAMIKVCNDSDLINRTLLHIQGLVSVYAKHYSLGLPQWLQNALLPGDILSSMSVKHGRMDFENRGRFEIESIGLLRHISGRTDWDKACALQINPDVNYYHCNEVLRESFYESQWDITKCEKYSIFLSQGSYPIKGLHFMLIAMPTIIKYFPSVRLYVAGTDPVKINSKMKGKIWHTSYGLYISKLIKHYKLSEHVLFTGPLNEQAMCAQYLRSHVFVSPSTIENSPNSLGEAMMLGMPCIASYVGGVPNMLTDKKEGFLYQADAPYMLAFYVIKVFSEEGEALRIAGNARNRAIQTHDRDLIVSNTLKIYNEIVSLSSYNG